MNIMTIVRKSLLVLLLLLSSVQSIAMIPNQVAASALMVVLEERQIKQKIAKYRKKLNDNFNDDDSFYEINNCLKVSTKELTQLDYMLNELGAITVGIIIAHKIIDGENNQHRGIKRSFHEIKTRKSMPERKRRKLAAHGSYKKYL